MHRLTIKPTRYNVDQCFNRKLKTTDELPKKSLPPPLLPATFRVVRNDHTRQSLRALLEFKCIISRQLPKMPRTYIAQMLFDGTHESLLAIDFTNVIVGGVSYRCFEEKDFAEIVFLAVDTQYREKRVGSQIMDNLKANLQKRGKRLLLTYADNTALGFFKKQGFEAVQQTATCSWNGYIKKYLQGTLMECKVFEELNYTRHKALLQQSKALIISKVNALLPTAPFRYSCKTLQAVLKKHPFSDDFRFERIPGLTQARWSTAQQRKLQQESEFSLVLQQVFAVESLRKMPEAAVFRGLQQLDLIEGETEELETWSSIEKRIVSGKNFKSVGQTCKAIEDMTQSYLKQLREWTPEANSVKQFQKKMSGPLSALLNRQIPIKINLAFTEKQSRPKKSQASSSRPVKK